MKTTTKRITRLALFIALALIMWFVESMLPPLISIIPGAKMGLSNVVTLTAIIILRELDAFFVQIIRCLLGGVITGGLTGLMFSLPAGIISFLVMAALYRFVFPKVSLMGISFVSGVLHNIVQLFMACLYLQNFSLFLMLPYYVLAGVAAGLFVGLVAFFVVKYLPKSLYLEKASNKS